MKWNFFQGWKSKGDVASYVGSKYAILVEKLAEWLHVIRKFSKCFKIILALDSC